MTASLFALPAEEFLHRPARIVLALSGLNVSQRQPLNMPVARQLVEHRINRRRRTHRIDHAYRHVRGNLYVTSEVDDKVVIARRFQSFRIGFPVRSIRNQLRPATDPADQHTGMVAHPRNFRTNQVYPGIEGSGDDRLRSAWLQPCTIRFSPSHCGWTVITSMARSRRMIISWKNIVLRSSRPNKK